MSQEVFKLTFNGDVLWRACNDSTGLISLDEERIEPPSRSLEQVVDRLVAPDYSFAPIERDQEMRRLIGEYGQIESYRNGNYVFNVDLFFSALNRITHPDVAATIGLNDQDIEYLCTAAETIRMELSGDPGWRYTFAATAREDLHEEVHQKLFPEFNREDGMIAHPVIAAEEAAPIKNGLAYFCLLAHSRELEN